VHRLPKANQRDRQQRPRDDQQTVVSIA